jgi:indole-3-glycerol phosphate synthase
MDAAVNLDLVPVVEVNNERDVEMARKARAEIVLINNRDLGTMSVDLSTTERLAPLLDGCLIISASGIKNRDDIARLRPLTSNFLVGTSLIKSKRPDRLLDQLITAPTSLSLEP